MISYITRYPEIRLSKVDGTGRKTNSLFLQVLALTVCTVSVLFVWQGNKGFSLWDEGFLWYGVQRVMLGDVPIRDFMSYDPGRYYWSAVLMRLCGDNGIMALRETVTVFQAIGLFVGLLLIGRCSHKRNFLYLFICTITLVSWMFPRHKLFDISLSILLVGALSLLVQRQTCRRYFFAGLCVGLAAVFGRNHGVYGVAGSFLVLAWINLGSAKNEDPGFIRGGALWTVGVGTGFSPVLFMALFVPGFTAAFWESIRFLFTVKTTNLPLPVPWPWLVDITIDPLGKIIREILIGIFFIGTLLFGVLSTIWAFWRKLQNRPLSPTLVAASFVSLPYAHYAYSRADISHLAQGIFPMLVGFLCLLNLLSDKVKWPLLLMLCTASLWVMHVFHPGWQCDINKQWVRVEISGNELWVDPATASDIKLLRGLADNYARNGRNFLVTPFWPGAYPLLGRKSPTWEIYALFPRSQAFQQAEIERIKSARPGFVLIVDLPLDGREELRYRNTHPLIYQYIIKHFKQLPGCLSSSSYLIYKEKEKI